MLAADSRPLRSPLEVLWALATVSCNDAEAAALASSGQWRRANIMMDIFKTSRIYQDVWVSATTSFGEFGDRDG